MSGYAVAVAGVNGCLPGAGLRDRGCEWAHAVGWYDADGGDVLGWCSEINSRGRWCVEVYAIGDGQIGEGRKESGLGTVLKLVIWVGCK